MHRYKEVIEAVSLQGTTSSKDRDESSVYIKLNPLLHRNNATEESIFALGFVKKYILYAKNVLAPVLTDDSTKVIVDAYDELRSGDGGVKTLPITPRLIESLIRLSVAHAKARLAKAVSREDAEAAVEIMKFAIYHDSDPEKNTRQQHQQQQRLQQKDGMEIEADSVDSESKKNSAQRDPQSLGKRKQRSTETKPNSISVDKEEHEESLSHPKKKRKTLASFPQRRDLFLSFLKQALGNNSTTQLILIKEVVDLANEKVTQKFSAEEVTQILKDISSTGQITSYDNKNIYI